MLGKSIEMGKHNFVVSEPKLTIFLHLTWNWEWLKTPFTACRYLLHSRDIRGQVQSCPKARALSMLGGSEWANTTLWLIDHFTVFLLFNAGETVVDNAVDRLRTWVNTPI